VALLSISAGMALSLSRGGIVAGLAGIVILVVATATHRPWSTSGARLIVRDGVLIAAVAVGGYLALSWLAANGAGLRPGEVAARPEQPQGTLVPITSEPSGGPGATPRPTAITGSNEPSQPVPTTGPSPSPSPSPATDGRYLGAGDTIELRWRNLQIAVADGLSSPLLGLGPDTFGQRYVEPTCTCPAHIPNQLSATFYESGVIGLASLLIVLGWVMVRGLQRRLDVYVASLATLLIGFQFTDALRFGATWLLIGLMIGLIIRAEGDGEPGDPERAGTP
jgi:hypothetical protein